MAKVNIKPLGDRVLLEICECKDEMKGGILIPDTAKEKPQEYKVIALGTGKTDDNGKKIPFDVKVGDILEIRFGQKALKIEVLAVAEAVRKDDAAAMYRELPS